MSTDIELLDPDKYAVKSRQDAYFPYLIDLDIVSREEWGAKPPRDCGEAVEGIPGNVVATLNTETPPCYDPLECEHTVRQIQRRHQKQGYSDVQYNFLIGCDGKVYEGRGWYWKSCPMLERPDDLPRGQQRLDIAYIGDYRDQLNPPPTMIDPTMFLFVFGVNRNLLEDRYKFFELDKRYVKPENEPDPFSKFE